jgi:beta-galactosidase GanA
MKHRYVLILIALFVAANVVVAQEKPASIPELRRQENATQLLVQGKPFIVLGGELGNSSASDMKYMRPIWKKMLAMHCNTVLAPAYWELMEPQKGRFDFTLIDSLILGARKHQLKLVLLWFGSWKNSMSCYVPSWVKKDYQNYPRAYDKTSTPQEILTPFSNNNLQADINAFRALLTHLKEKDGKDQTVIMIQVENEIGMLPSARDFHPDATKAFNLPVPARLIEYLQKNKTALAPTVFDAWKTGGFKTKGTWEQVFGKGLATDEIFVAWYFADFTNKITEEGKKVYPLPMFVNAALNRPNVKPGDYPSGGPLPHIIDIWKAAGPAIDFLSPDFYNPDFKYWNDLYTQKNNPLFIPEIRFEASVAAKAFYAIGHYHAIGFSPFSIESTDTPEKEPIGKSYEIISQLTPLIALHRGKNSMNGSLLDKKHYADTIKFGEYTFTIKHDYTLGWSPKAKEDEWPEAGGFVIQTAPDEFIIAGTGIVITFSSDQPEKGRVGILNIEEGIYNNGTWIPGRTMNGDQSHQGRHLRFAVGDFGIQKLVLYRYRQYLK